MRQLFILLCLCTSLFTKPLFAQEAPLVYPFAYQNQWGIVQEDRVVVMAPQLDSIAFFSSTGAVFKYALALDHEKYGLLNADGSWLAKPKLDSIGWEEYYAKNTHWAASKGKLGLLATKTQKAKWLVKPKFTAVSEFYGRKVALAPVAINGRWGVINGDGKLITPCVYDTAQLLDEYSEYPDVKLTLNGEAQYVDAFGALLSPERIQEIENELEMWGDDIVFADVSMEDAPKPRLQINQEKNPDGGTDVILTKNGQEEERVNVPAEYFIQEAVLDDAYNRSQLGYILVKKGNKFGFWGHHGEVATPAKYDHINWKPSNRYQQLAYLHQGENVGLADYRGYQIFPAVFSSISEYTYYFRLVHPDGYVGYGNEKGEVFFPKTVNTAD